MRSKFGLIIFILSIGLLTVSLYIYQYLTYPIQYPGKERSVLITPGSSFSEILDKLESRKILENKLQFRILALLTKKTSFLKAGEYKINTQWSRLKLLRTLNQGKVVLHKVQIPEGSTWWETAQLVENSSLGNFQTFARAVHNKTLLNKYNIPGNTAEGFLFPETYTLTKRFENSNRFVVEALLGEFWKQTRKRLWKQKIPDLKRVRYIVTLASLIEKETAQKEEKKKIAGVFENRLEKGIYLQCDPTVIYGLGQNFDGNLTHRDLKNSTNPYNTYQHLGLPPTPICSPGISSLQAAKNPDEHSYLYFVSQGNGTHEFSRNLREHRQAVKKYQLN